jgi:adenosylmethionine-8-amino-7-oxononanoate aminotransferase
MLNNQQLIDRDLRAVWHPCTQMKDHENLPPIPIRRGQGVWLEDFDGNRYIDAISSWWVNLFGHANPHINAALQKQAGQLEHVILAGCTHEPVVRLSERLAELTPGNLSRCFYAENGSAAVEIALKMSFQYWRNCGEPGKIEFINLENSYHGETIGALSVGDVSIFKDTFEPLLLKPHTVPSPDYYNRESGESPEQYASRRADDLERTLDKHAHSVSAVIVEPLVQCAGGMRMHHPVYLKKIRQLCDRYQVHLIADECAVGFGRTGTMFACEQAGITPDFMCLAKGLTGGYLPMSAVVTNDQIYQAFYDDYQSLKGFLHSHSYTGNALTCAVALATLELFEDNNTIENNKTLSTFMAEAAQRFHDHPFVSDVRQTGMIVAIEMAQDKVLKTPFPWQQRRGMKVYEYAIRNQALLRPLGNVVYFMPPYVITPDEIELLCDVAWEGISIATSDS